MYVHIVSFKVIKGEETTFVELQKFEENTEAKPAGLDHYHIFKDINDDSRYFLIEYWESKKDKERLAETQEYKHFQDIRKLAIEKKLETIDCEVVV
jgi:quinol monooxygenase YgiN